MLNFAKDATKKGQTPIVAMMPTGLDLKYFKKMGRWPYQPLLHELKEVSFGVINIGKGILRRLADEDPCHLFDNCSAHFNDRGYALVAEVMSEHLKSIIVMSMRR